MVIILKILLFLLMAIGCFSVYFLFRDYKKVISSSEIDESSLYDKIIVFLMAFISISGLLAVVVLSSILFFSNLTVKLPW